MLRPFTLVLAALSLATAATADPIGPVHAADAAARVGKPLTVRGVVTAVFSTAHATRLCVQDATGALYLYGSPMTCAALGDSLEATGTLTQYSGLMELSGTATAPLAIKPLGRAALEPQPVVLTLAQAAAAEKPDGSEPDESRLVEVRDVFVRMSDGTMPAADVRFKDDTNYRLVHAAADSATAFVTLRVQDAEGCEGSASLDGAAIPRGRLHVTGVLLQHGDRTTGKGGYQILPRQPSDLATGKP